MHDPSRVQLIFPDHWWYESKWLNSWALDSETNQAIKRDNQSVVGGGLIMILNLAKYFDFNNFL